MSGDGIAEFTWAELSPFAADIRDRITGDKLGTAADFDKRLARARPHLEGLARYEDGLRNRVRREVEWLRQGVKARGTKARGRIQEAERLIRKHAMSYSLRTLDAIQLSVVLDFRARGLFNHFVCADRNLCKVAVSEALTVINPEIP